MASKVHSARARKAALDRHHPNQTHTEAAQELAAAKLEAYVSKVVAEAPPLSREQLDAIAAALHGAKAVPSA